MRYRRCLQRSRCSSRRRAATAVECAFVLSTLLMIVFVMLDLGLAVLQFNSLSAAARWTAREAAVRGENAPPERIAWGPATYEGTAADQSEHAAVARKCLTTLNHRDVTLRLEWPDGDNHVDQRVRVTLNYPYQPILPFPLLQDIGNLSAVSTMNITH